MKSITGGGAIAFGCVVGDAVLGFVVRGLLPEEHLSTDTKGRGEARHCADRDDGRVPPRAAV